MATYTGSPTYHSSITIIEILDRIAGGLNGFDNVPNEELGQTTNYFKKRKGDLISGYGTPSGDYGLILDSDSTDVTFYYNITNGSFWKASTTSPISWTNITKNVVLNVEELKLNSNGDDSLYAKLAYTNFVEHTGSTGVNITNNYSRQVHIRFNKAYIREGDSNTFKQLQVEEDQIIINAKVVQESQNSDAQYAIKNYDVGSVLASKYIQWDEELENWRLIDQNGLFQRINVLSLYVGGIQISESEYDLVIDNDPDLFDELFNQSPSVGGLTTITPQTPSGTSYTTSGTDKNLTLPGSYDTEPSLAPGVSEGAYAELYIGTMLWSSTTSGVADTFSYIQGSTYGEIKFKCADGYVWDGDPFPLESNGTKTFNLPRTGAGTTDGGYFTFYYHYTYWRYAFQNTTSFIVISQEGRVFKDSISIANLVVDENGNPGPAGATLTGYNWGIDYNCPTSVLLKNYDYMLTNKLSFSKPFFKLKTSESASLSFPDTYPMGIGSMVIGGGTGTYPFTISSSTVFFTITADSNEVDIRIKNPLSVPTHHFFKITGNYNNVKLSLNNINSNDSTLIDSELTINNLELYDDNNKYISAVYKADESILNGNYNEGTTKTFDTVTNSIVVGIDNCLSTIGTGDFDY